MYQAFGFDLDNTLYDQGQHLRSFFAEAGEWLRAQSGVAPEIASACFVAVWERRTMAYPFLFDEALRDLGLWRADRVRDLITKYRAHRCGLMLEPGVSGMLDRLSRRYPLFLITDGNGELQRSKVEELRLSEFFKFILYTDDYGPGWYKPSAHAFSRAASLLDLPAAACLFVGDDPDRDIEGARRAGMATALVLRGPFQHRPCVPPPDIALERIAQLETALSEQRLAALAM